MTDEEKAAYYLLHYPELWAEYRWRRAGYESHLPEREPHTSWTEHEGAELAEFDVSYPGWYWLRAVRIIEKSLGPESLYDLETWQKENRRSGVELDACAAWRDIVRRLIAVHDQIARR